MTSTQPIFTARQCSVFAVGFLLVRLGLLIAFYQLTGKQEVASDVFFHKLIIDEPFAILAGTSRLISSYPPFQWLVEWPLFNLYAFAFDDFLSIRLLMISVEFFTFLLLLNNAHLLFERKVIAVTVVALFIISPHQIFSSVFFVQEDVISQLFILAAALSYLMHQRTITICILIAAVLIAKIFFVIPLFYVVMFTGNYSFIKRTAQGIASLLPIAIVYLITIYNALINGGDVPIRDFTPDAAYAANFWVLILKTHPDALTSVKNWSLIISFAAQLFVITVFFYFRETINRSRTLIVLSIPLAVFFGTFYQHMPEYFLMLWPLLAVLCSSIPQQIILAAVFSFAWTPRILHGLQTILDNFGSTVKARSEIFGPLLQSVPIDADYLNTLALWAQSFIYSIMLIAVIALAVRSEQRASKKPE